jgi:hypothetical protein
MEKDPAAQLLLKYTNPRSLDRSDSSLMTQHEVARYLRMAVSPTGSGSRAGSYTGSYTGGPVGASTYASRHCRDPLGAGLRAPHMEGSVHSSGDQQLLSRGPSTLPGTSLPSNSVPSSQGGSSLLERNESLVAYYAKFRRSGSIGNYDAVASSEGSTSDTQSPRPLSLRMHQQQQQVQLQLQLPDQRQALGDDDKTPAGGRPPIQAVKLSVSPRRSPLPLSALGSGVAHTESSSRNSPFDGAQLGGGGPDDVPPAFLLPRPQAQAQTLAQTAGNCPSSSVSSPLANEWQVEPNLRPEAAPIQDTSPAVQGRQPSPHVQHYAQQYPMEQQPQYQQQQQQAPVVQQPYQQYYHMQPAQHQQQIQQPSPPPIPVSGSTAVSPSWYHTSQVQYFIAAAPQQANVFAGPQPAGVFAGPPPLHSGRTPPLHSSMSQHPAGQPPAPQPTHHVMVPVAISPLHLLPVYAQPPAPYGSHPSTDHSGGSLTFSNYDSPGLHGLDIPAPAAGIMRFPYASSDEHYMTSGSYSNSAFGEGITGLSAVSTQPAPIITVASAPVAGKTGSPRLRTLQPQPQRVNAAARANWSHLGLSSPTALAGSGRSSADGNTSFSPSYIASLENDREGYLHQAASGSRGIVSTPERQEAARENARIRGEHRREKF